MIILAGDVGGTKTNLALFRSEGARFEEEPASLRSFPSGNYPGLEAILGEFLAGRPSVDRACVGVAGPVIEGRSTLTNLPWVVDERSLRGSCGTRHAWLVNDLQALSYAVLRLPAGSLEILKPAPVEPRGTIAVVAPGTGLGQGFLVWAGGRHVALPSEGGHADFAPRDERELRLLRFVQASGEHASVERIVSGPGLHTIYRFLREAEGLEEVPAVDARLAAEPPPHVIVEEALNGRSRTCGESVRLFTSLLGAVTGNVALQVLATGGLYLGGGMTPAVLPVLKEGPFLEAFLAKGRFRDFLLNRVRVAAIMDGKAALLGAAHHALTHEENGE